MRWTKLRSNVIRLAGWDSATRDLFLRFQQGKLYVFRNVDPDLVEDILTAKAPGSVFGATLRSSPFAEKLDGFPDASSALEWARINGWSVLATSSTGSVRVKLGRMSEGQLVIAGSALDTDEDCGGAHTWFFTGTAPADSPALSLWHVNDATGQVVPPTPRLLWRPRALSARP